MENMPMPLPEKNLILQTKENLAPELGLIPETWVKLSISVPVFCTLGIMDENGTEPAFKFKNNEIHILNSIQDLETLKQEISCFSIAPKTVETILKFLSENLGKKCADLCGFKPRFLMDDDTWTEEPRFTSQNLLFGQVYIPELDNFSVGIKNAQSEQGSGEITIKISGWGAGGTKEYKCSVNESFNFTKDSFDLQIPAKFQVIKWENQNDEFFITIKPISIADYISPLKVDNPYNLKEGFDQLKNMDQCLDLSTEDIQGPMELEVKIEQKTCIQLSASIPIPGLTNVIPKINGTAKVEKEFAVAYSIPSGYKFAKCFENKNYFRHLWALYQKK